ncbi:MAG: histidinol-phosphatase [Nitratireductor sp.]
MPDKILADMEAFLHELCDAAALETMPRFRVRIDVENKQQGGFDPVTAADKAAEAAIRAMIRARYPDHGIIGEEEAPLNPDAEFCWHIDPVDGTRAFIAGLPSWGTLIGLSQNGKAVAGIMHQPFTGERYFTSAGQSWLAHGSRRETVTTRKTGNLDGQTIMTTSPFLFSEGNLPRYRTLESRCQLARYGCDCYAYAMLASGHVGLVVESGLKSYDIAALIPVIEQAGGVVTTWDGGNAIGGGSILAAANPELHAQAMEILGG